MDQQAIQPELHPAPARASLILRWIARVILIAGAAFWSFFCIADGIGDAQELGLMGFIMMLPAMVIVLGVLIVAWRWELAGAILLLGVTVLGGYFFAMNLRSMDGVSLEDLGGVVVFFAIFVLPFLAPAVLLLIKLRLDRNSSIHELEKEHDIAH